MEVNEACKICKAYAFYNLPSDERNDNNNDDDLVYKINVTLNKEGLIKIITLVLFLTVLVGIICKLCRKREKTAMRTRWIIEMFFSILNIAWIASCVILLTKCTSMLIYKDDDVHEIVKLFPWYICLVLSCCIMDISESCAYRLLKITSTNKMIMVDPDDVDEKEIIKGMYMKEEILLPPSYNEAMNESTTTVTNKPTTAPKDETDITKPDNRETKSSDLNNNNNKNKK